MSTKFDVRFFCSSSSLLDRIVSLFLRSAVRLYDVPNLCISKSFNQPEWVVCMMNKFFVGCEDDRLRCKNMILERLVGN